MDAPKELLDLMNHYGWERSPCEDRHAWAWRMIARGSLARARLWGVRGGYCRVQFGWLPFLPNDDFICSTIDDLARVLEQRRLILED
jgi:hypothetical protein